jgi:hypothetical protein
VLTQGAEFAGGIGPALHATGTAGANTRPGHAWADRLAGGTGNDASFAETGDTAVCGHLDQFSTGGEITHGSGIFQPVRAATVVDVQPGMDRILRSRDLVGGFDAVIDGGATADAAGKFDAAAVLANLAEPVVEDFGLL